MSRYFSTPELLAPPVERAAFSDRQAYVCAELSKLAYFKFEGGHTLDDALGIVRTLLANDRRLPEIEDKLRGLLTNEPSSEDAGRAALGKILEAAGFRFEGARSVSGTQVFFCTRVARREDGSTKTFAYLVFRGTEPNRFEDIKTDVNAKLAKHEIDGEVIELHSGYLNAFELIREKVKNWIENTEHDQLIITGHSLGGALAIVATRLLASDSTGACYTFGAPPVGGIEVQNSLKTPVYEIVNEIDIVPRLPTPWLAVVGRYGYRLLGAALKPFTVAQRWLVKGTWDEKLDDFIDGMTRYRHPGYISYLVGSGSEARLRWNVDVLDKIRWWIHFLNRSVLAPFRKLVGDHMIDAYIEKLRVHGLRRNG